MRERDELDASELKDKVPGEGADHKELTVSKIDELDDPIDHGVAKGDKCIDAAETKTVEDLFEEVRHGESRSRAITVRNSVPSGCPK